MFEKLFRNIFFMILITLICTMISVFFEHIKMSESNIVMIYLLGILLFSFIAEGYVYSFFASVFAVLLYNFFFTEPFYTFKVKNPDYIITFFVLFIVGFITSMLTIRVKLGRQLLEDREAYIYSLYFIEKRLLNVKSGVELAEVSAEELYKQLNANIMIKFFDSSGKITCCKVRGEEIFSGTIDISACLETFQSGSPCGKGSNLFSDAKAFYIPIISHNGVLGVIGISLIEGGNLSNTQLGFLDVILPQIAVVLERERIYEKQKQTQMEIQGERLRADMLKAVSHDFRTPLTGIMGLSSTFLENYEQLNDLIKKNFLQSIYEDADWLNELVENILQKTRFDEGRVKLRLEQEAAEEIITEAVTHVKKRALNHKISVKIPHEIVLINVDGVLIRQVLVNLLNNAINYTPEKSEIIVSLYHKDGKVIFEVADNGPGISQEDMSIIFNQYEQKNINKISKRRGVGLGLSLCKSIVEAHNGKISIRKNEPHGTNVSFYILTKKVNESWNH
ncbi:DUF4118 domain-containing protein [Anaerosacchariphilus polymeriproducens]|uniref:histidine kinase n=1 Tax=Anaerosacchariphilus polymeriproducens TaxID=1812858 RepID=A0A371AYQ3_9FIRM|nr:DUF4118 domain-containing protein [Anaerosacchariphilus polymeriproducens]RDU24728.1 DUF4118 domain-containing protein [Anaerosacchariphilus polymeriproducens]